MLAPVFVELRPLACCKTLASANLSHDRLLYMFVCFGGRERSTAAFDGVLGDAGFVTRNINPLDGDALVAIESKEDK